MSATDAWTTISSPQAGRLAFRRLRLEVVAGVDRGHYVEFDADPVRIGASPRNHLVLTDRRVSALHAEIEVLPGGVRLRDPGSKNGTCVDGVRVVEALLHDGARIRLGETLLGLRGLVEQQIFDLSPGTSFGSLIGGSAAMAELYWRIERFAGADAPVLVTGETGTGKEAVARALHELSARRDRPLVVVNCPAMPVGLIESELFGHERGAFTGADQAVPGAFERAGEGTILLDEIGDMPLSLQPKLLGILERRSVKRIGSSIERPIRARVLAATSRDLAQAVARGAFRADLYYRLSVCQLRVPPLRERRDDIPLLVEHFLRELHVRRAIDTSVLDALSRHMWPGNVRELRNAVQRLVILGDPALAEHSAADSRPGVTLQASFDLPYSVARDRLLDSFRSVYVEHVLRESHGNVARAARRAGVDRMTLYRLLKRSEVR